MQWWVLLCWIPFRVTATRPMLAALGKFIAPRLDFHVANIGLGNMAPFSTSLLVAGFLSLHLYSQLRGGIDTKLARLPLTVTVPVAIAGGMVLFLLWPSAERPFIYFQF